MRPEWFKKGDLDRLAWLNGGVVDHPGHIYNRVHPSHWDTCADKDWSCQDAQERPLEFTHSPPFQDNEKTHHLASLFDRHARVVGCMRFRVCLWCKSIESFARPVSNSGTAFFIWIIRQKPPKGFPVALFENFQYPCLGMRVRTYDRTVHHTADTLGVKLLSEIDSKRLLCCLQRIG